MPRTKSIDTNQVKALRKLLKSLGLATTVINSLITQMKDHISDLSSKACDVQLYLAAHPDIKNPAAYVATTLRRFAASATSRIKGRGCEGTDVRGYEDRENPRESAAECDDEPIEKMELWGND